MTKLGRHIDVIMVRPVIPHIAGIVVGYWRNGCSYGNIAREAGLHSNTVYGQWRIQGGGGGSRGSGTPPLGFPGKSSCPWKNNRYLLKTSDK